MLIPHLELDVNNFLQYLHRRLGYDIFTANLPSKLLFESTHSKLERVDLCHN